MGKFIKIAGLYLKIAVDFNIYKVGNLSCVKIGDKSPFYHEVVYAHNPTIHQFLHNQKHDSQ